MANKSKTVNLKLSITFADEVEWTIDNIEQLLNNLDDAINAQIDSDGIAPTWNNGNAEENEYEDESTHTEDWLFTFIEPKHDDFTTMEMEYILWEIRASQPSDVAAIQSVLWMQGDIYYCKERIYAGLMRQVDIGVLEIYDEDLKGDINEVSFCIKG